MLEFIIEKVLPFKATLQNIQIDVSDYMHLAAAL